MVFQSKQENFSPDDLDLRILELLTEDSTLKFKEVGKMLKIDQRTVAKRILAMKKSGVLVATIEINWAKIGVRASAYVGSTTAQGQSEVAKLHEFVRNDPHVIEAFETVGAYQYVLRVIAPDIQQLRESVMQTLEPLTADLATSMISSTIKTRDYASYLRFLRRKVASQSPEQVRKMSDATQ